MAFDSIKIPFSVVETIRKRRSVRTYDDRPLAADLLAKINDYKAQLSNPFGVKVSVHQVNKRIGVNGEKLGTYGTIKGASTFLGLSASKVPLALVAAGYQFENLILYITSLGLGTVWLAATFSRGKFQSAMGIPADHYFPAISPVGYPEKARFLERIMRSTMGSDNRKPWSELFFDDSFAVPLSESRAGEYAEALEMLRLAPSATNAQPWRVVKAADTFHFYESHKEKTRPDDALIKQVDLGIAISHFDLTMQQTKGMKGFFTSRDPLLSDTPPTCHYLVSWTKS